jgi:hypothetical protein
MAAAEHAAEVMKKELENGCLSRTRLHASTCWTPASIYAPQSHPGVAEDELFHSCYLLPVAAPAPTDVRQLLAWCGVQSFVLKVVCTSFVCSHLCSRPLSEFVTEAIGQAQHKTTESDML